MTDAEDRQFDETPFTVEQARYIESLKARPLSTLPCPPLKERSQTMTDAEIDALDSLALRKAVAEAVGWEWHRGSPFCPCSRKIMGSHAVENRQVSIGRARFIGETNWDDAIAACDAVVGVEKIVRDEVHQCCMVVFGMGKAIAESDGVDPSALCRALLKAIAMATKLTAIERAAT